MKEDALVETLAGERQEILDCFGRFFWLELGSNLSFGGFNFNFHNFLLRVSHIGQKKKADGKKKESP